MKRLIVVRIEIENGVDRSNGNGLYEGLLVGMNDGSLRRNKRIDIVIDCPYAILISSSTVSHGAAPTRVRVAYSDHRSSW